MKREPEGPGWADFEARLRDAAPELPERIRERVLARAAAEWAGSPRRRRVSAVRLAYVALLLLGIGANHALDARRERLVSAPNRTTAALVLAAAPVSSSDAVTPRAFGRHREW